MEAIIHIRCEGCRAAIVVVPPAVTSLAGEDGDLEEVTGVEGQPFALADSSGRYACPECGHPGRAPRLSLS